MAPVIDFSMALWDHFCMRPARCCGTGDFEYPLTFFLSMLECLQCFAFAALVVFMFNSLDLVVNRYFGPIISNNGWVLYFIVCGFESIFGMMNEVRGVNIDNKDIIFISIWAQRILIIATPTVICDCLVFHILRKLRRLQPGSFLNEIRKASATPPSEYVVRIVTAILSFIILIILLANCGINISEERFHNINVAMSVLLTLESLIAIIFMVIVIIKSNQKAGFSKKSRIYMVISLILYIWTPFSYIYPASRDGSDYFGPCMGAMSLYDLGLIFRMAFNVTLFLFIVSEYKRLSEKMCQVFLKTNN